MYKTNKMINFYSKSLNDAVGENCMTVYEKNKKINQFRPREAPLLHRNAVNYSKDYCSKEAIDYKSNLELAELFKPPDLPETIDVLPKETSYMSTFKRCDV